MAGLSPAASFAFAHRAPAAAVQPNVIERILSRLHIGPRPHSNRRPAPAIPEIPSQPVDAETLHLTAANDLLERALAHRQRGEMTKAERRCRQALYLAPNLLPAMELLQPLWDESPTLRLRRALRDRILRTQLAAPIEAVPAQKELV